MLHDLITNKRRLFDAGAHTELRAQLNRSHHAALVMGNLTSNARTDTSGISARVYRNGVYGFASMAEVSDAAAEAVVRAAGDNARFMDKHIQKNRAMFPAIPYGYRRLDSDYSVTEQKTYVDFLREVDAYVAKKPNLTSRNVILNSDSMEKLICVSDGMDAHTVLPRTFVYVMLTAEGADGAPVELYKAIGGLGTFHEVFTTPDKLFPEIDKLYDQLMDKRGAVFAEAGLKTVIIGGDLCGMLAHEAVGHTVEADLVLGGSVAGPMLGKRVASDLVTLVDFAHTYQGKPAPLPIYVDDEGTPASDEVLIRDGILTGYMNSRESATRFDMTPKGNARAYLFSDEPLIRMRNTAVLPGKDTLSDMLASVDDGYYLIATNNGQADTTGEFMFGVCMGYEIKGGKLARAIKDTTISGVAFEMMKTIDMVSDNMTWCSAGFCGKKQPMPVGMGGPEIRCKVMMGGR